ncbi:hypothetical protein Nepgr_015237 [Nepenthes gracilis]|uniref:histidine kinase n=1 Tax=Nepenthes gracilis TaxID=150966 RepID=A0AAD3XR43_NEPGR|nr:hypothetical protein Nepgr_015237 [Nepenthes gracilis]
MVCQMENDKINVDMDMEVLTSMWPEDINEDGSQFNVEKPREDHDMLEEVSILEEPSVVDLQRLMELNSSSEKGSSQLAYLVKHWEYKQANAVRLLREELDSLTEQRQEVELKKLEILEEHRFEEERYDGDKRQVSVLDDLYVMYQAVPRKKDDVPFQSKRFESDAEYDTIVYWKQRALHLEKLLEASLQREQMLMEKLKGSIKNMEMQSTPVEELSQMLKRADNFIHFILQNAPIVLGHVDIIGKTDLEILSGAGMQESLDFKLEVLERGLPGKREITFDTELFGSKTFLIYVEPVFNKAGETIGVNYIGMEITDQVRKREKMAKLREEIAVQKAMETELNKTIHITEETMRSKQMLATMSHEIRSPLSGVVSMAEILATTKLDREQQQLLEVMISSGDLVLQLINDILDLSKVESGVMKLEAIKFRPREVVKHVLQTAAASLRKKLTLEGHVAENVPVEVIGDVLRIRQIITNLVSNAIKFTHEGKVGIKLYVVAQPNIQDRAHKSVEDYSSSVEKGSHIQRFEEAPYQNHKNHDEPRSPLKGKELKLRDEGKPTDHPETAVWIRCDVYDTGIGIPETALPALFKKYMQVSADHARKYGGTGLGLAICKQLVELMGGYLTVSSKEHCGSIFSFVLPYRVSSISDDHSDDTDELPNIIDHDTATADITAGYFCFQPRALGSLFSSGLSSRNQHLAPTNFEYMELPDINGVSPDAYTLSSSASKYKDKASVEIACWVVDPGQASNGSSLKQNANIDDKCTNRGDEGADGDCQAENPSTYSIGKGVDEITKMNKPQEAFQMQKTDSSMRSVPSSNSEVTKSAHKPRILLVEDNKINVMVTKSMMKQLGHIIDVVNNGVEAVRAVQSHSYDLILMDVCMPVMDGLQATRIIRTYEETGNWDSAAEAGIERPMHSLGLELNSQFSMPSLRRIPIIAMTANALSESADECFANGMDSFVSKPVTFQKLRQCLEQYLP